MHLQYTLFSVSPLIPIINTIKTYLGRTYLNHVNKYIYL